MTIITKNTNNTAIDALLPLEIIYAILLYDAIISLFILNLNFQYINLLPLLIFLSH